MHIRTFEPADEDAWSKPGRMPHRCDDKCDEQLDQRPNSWRATFALQRDELADLLESGTLRRYADEILGQAYTRALRQAALETGLAENAFPAETPFSLDNVLAAR